MLGDPDLWMPTLLLSAFFWFAGFLGYSLLRGRLSAVLPLCFQASLVLLIALVELRRHPLNSDWSLWGVLLVSAWTISLSAFFRRRVL